MSTSRLGSESNFGLDAAETARGDTQEGDLELLDANTSVQVKSNPILMQLNDFFELQQEELKTKYASRMDFLGSYAN